MQEAPSILSVKRRRWQQTRLLAALDREGYQTRVAAGLEEVG
jgi:hypothetical protein